MGNFKIKKRIFIIVAMLALLLSGIAGITGSHSSTEAFSFCGNVGSSMGRSSVGGMFQGASNSDVAGRRWTAEELFRSSVSYSSYYGEGPGTWLLAEKIDRGSHVDGFDSVLGTLEDSRSLTCIVGFDWIPNLLIGIANTITGLISSIILMLVGRDVMAETLTTIIGGAGGGDDGLIGTFLSSFYMPLILIAVAIMVITIIYKGLIKRQMREALSSLIWSVGAFIIGVALMLSPQMLASLPQTITSTITTCVLGAISGQNCMTGAVETPSVLAGDECISTVDGGSDSESVVNSLNCTIWKTFTLEPWAENQFGEPYNDLYTKNPPSGGDIWSNLPEGEEDKYCVNFASNASYDDSVSGTPDMDLPADAEICNVALYHLFIKTEMTDTVSNDDNNYADGLRTDDTGQYDGRWYDIIVPMAEDSSNWDNWAGSGQLFSRIGTSLMGVIAIIASATVLLVLGIFAGAYKVTGLILMAFAPVFFLFAIEPTRGKRIFLGWLETLISSLLKYFAITVLIVVSLIMYAGLLANTSGVTSLIGIITLTVALHMYRKEIVDLIGAANMGGERLSNKAGEIGSKAGKQFKEKASAHVGGTIGAALGNRKARKQDYKARNKTIEDLQSKLADATTDEEKDFYQEEIDKEKEAKFRESGSLLKALQPKTFKGDEEGERKKHLKGALKGRFRDFKGGLSGGRQSVSRSMKRGTGLAANIFQQRDRTKLDLERQSAEANRNVKKEREEFEARRIANEVAKQDKNAGQDNSKDNSSDNSGDNGKGNDSKKSGKTEEKKNIDVEYEKARKANGKVDYQGELTQEERDELDKLADKIGNEQTDQELLDMIRSDEVSSDRNKEAIVANEINARINAHAEMETEVTVFDKANPVERGEMSRGEWNMEGIENDFNDFQFNTEGEVQGVLNQYRAELEASGITGDVAKEREETLVNSKRQDIENSKSSYQKAVKLVVDNQSASVSMLQSEFGLKYGEANGMLKTMELDGVISSQSDGESKVNVKTVEEAKNLEWDGKPVDKEEQHGDSGNEGDGNSGQNESGEQEPTKTESQSRDDRKAQYRYSGGPSRPDDRRDDNSGSGEQSDRKDDNSGSGGQGDRKNDRSDSDEQNDRRNDRSDSDEQNDRRNDRSDSDEQNDRRNDRSDSDEQNDRRNDRSDSDEQNDRRNDRSDSDEQNDRKDKNDTEYSNDEQFDFDNSNIDDFDNSDLDDFEKELNDSEEELDDDAGDVDSDIDKFDDLM